MCFMPKLFHLLHFIIHLGLHCYVHNINKRSVIKSPIKLSGRVPITGDFPLDILLFLFIIKISLVFHYCLADGHGTSITMQKLKSKETCDLLNTFSHWVLGLGVNRPSTSRIPLTLTFQGSIAGRNCTHHRTGN